MSTVPLPERHNASMYPWQEADLLAYGAACRKAALEEAVAACEAVRTRGDVFKDYENNHPDGHMDGCNNCANAIHALIEDAPADSL